MIIHYPRGKKTSISKDFNSSEFDCACLECGCTLIDTVLVGLLQTLRDRLGKPIHITSGYRCPQHQKDLRDAGFETASGISTHETGRAADICSPEVSGIELEKIARACGFESVGVARGWIHVDLRTGFRRWVYKG